MLALVSKYLLARRTLIYCHGDDLQGADAARRRRWFAVADRIVAANRYAADQLAGVFAVPRTDSPGAQWRGSGCLLSGPAACGAGSAPWPWGAQTIAQRDATGAAQRRRQVIEALPAVLRQFPDALYLIVGEGPQQGALQQRAQQLGLADRVKFAGAVGHGESPVTTAPPILFCCRTARKAAKPMACRCFSGSQCLRPASDRRQGGRHAEIVRDGENGLAGGWRQCCRDRGGDLRAAGG